MKWIFLTVIAVWIVGGTSVLALRFMRERRGRRDCTQWLCPQCRQHFGGTFREWRRRQDIALKSELFTGPILHCSHWHQDFWFAWTGRHLPVERMTDAFEVVDHS